MDAFENLKIAIYPYVQKHYAILQKQMPYLTGNLAYNALHLVKTRDGFDIQIDLSIAPYAEWIDRPDYVSYQYFDKAFQLFYKNLKADLEGNLKWR